MPISSEIFARGDLIAILRAIAFTAATAGGQSPHDAAWRNGYAAALWAVATAIHADGELRATLPDAARRVQG